MVVEHPLSDSSVRPRIVEVDQVLLDQRVEVLIIGKQNVIRASSNADETFGHRVHHG